MENWHFRKQLVTVSIIIVIGGTGVWTRSSNIIEDVIRCYKPSLDVSITSAAVSDKRMHITSAICPHNIINTFGNKTSASTNDNICSNNGNSKYNRSCELHMEDINSIHQNNVLTYSYKCIALWTRWSINLYTTFETSFCKSFNDFVWFWSWMAMDSYGQAHTDLDWYRRTPMDLLECNW